MSSQPVLSPERHPHPMRDLDIRRSLVTRLQARFDPEDALIRNELGVLGGTRRVDVVCINGHLDGWEIKSDVDTLRRLAGQAAAFSRVLDRATLVTTDRHLTPATRSLPPWWGVQRASWTKDRRVRLTLVRAAHQSPALDPMALAQLLWREEALAELRRCDLARGLSKKSRWYVWERLALSVPLPELRALVRTTLRARREWSGG